MPETVEAATGAEREPDAETPAEKSAITLNYEEMLAALNAPVVRAATLAVNSWQSHHRGLARRLVAVDRSS